MEQSDTALYIRPISLALIKNPQGQYLYHQGRDKVKNETFYRPLGGGIDFGELAEATLKREMLEELNEEIIIHEQLTLFENIFKYEQRFGHEIVILFSAEFKNRNVYEKKELEIHEHNGLVSTAVWRSLEEIKQEKAHLYPIGLDELIKRLGQ